MLLDADGRRGRAVSPDASTGPTGRPRAGVDRGWESEVVVTEGAPPARGRGLSLDRIVTEAIALIDEQGIGMASMRNLGQRLGVRAMSLYRYVDTRETLFDAVVERIVGELDDDPEVPQHAGEGWREYLDGLARGIRRYALAHPHAFPLVATRPPAAPWVNPPLRSLRWIERMLTTLHDQGLSDDQTLFAYRSFNSFLLGFLLLETSGMTLNDPLPGDGSFQSGTAPVETEPGDVVETDPADPTDPVPAALSPVRTTAQREAVDAATTARENVDPAGEVGADEFPTIHRLRAGLSVDVYETEFAIGLKAMLDRVAAHMASSGGSAPGAN